MILRIVVLLLLLLSTPLYAHNGAVAIAVPVEGIVVDGDLDDWPEGVTRYRVELSQFGGAPASEEDLSSFFHVGWNPHSGVIYVFIEVVDQSIEAKDGSWISDGCDVFLGVEGIASTPLQYAVWGTTLFRQWDRDDSEVEIREDMLADRTPLPGSGTSDGPMTIHAERDGVEITVKREAGIHRYEWAIDLRELDAAGHDVRLIDAAVSFDVVVGDLDGDGSFSWVSWGRGTTKRTSESSMGDLILVTSGSEVGQLQGLIDNVVAPTLTVAEFRTRAWVVIAILLVESITHLLLFAFCRSLRASLYFAILTGGLGGVTSLRLVGEQSMVAIGAMMAVCLLSALLFIYSVFYARPPKFLYVAAVACLATVMAILVDWQFYLLLSLLCVVVGLEVLRVVLAAIIQRKPGRWLIGTSALGLVSWMAIFSVLMLFSDTQQMWAIPTAVILLPMLVHVSREFARVSRGLEQKIVEVERVSGESLEYERALRREIERELQTAHDMQMGLMPTGPPELLGLEIAGRCVPMNHVGGDIFQYHPREDGVAVAMADVTGHAMEAAIPVVMFSGILDKQIEISGDLSEQFSGLNRSLCRSLADHKYICFTMAEIDTETKSLRLANSGCPYPVHYHDGEITELQVDAYPLGVRPDTTYEVLEDQLFPGDYLVLYSDGIPETVNAGDEMFGFEAAAAAVQAACAEGVSAEEVIERLMGAAREFAGDEPQADDMTCVVVRVEAEPVQ